MILNVIEGIKEIAEKVAPYAVFEADEASMVNIKIDSVTRKVTIDKDGVPVEVSNSFIYVEEPTYGYYDIPVRGFQQQRTFIRIYFCKFEEMHASAYKGTSKYSEDADKPNESYRINLRNQIEEEMVRPFLYQLKNSVIGMMYRDMLTSTRVIYPRTRFDANEVSVGLEIMYYENWCLDNYKNLPNP